MRVVIRLVFEEENCCEREKNFCSKSCAQDRPSHRAPRTLWLAAGYSLEYLPASPPRKAPAQTAGKEVNSDRKVPPLRPSHPVCGGRIFILWSLRTTAIHADGKAMYTKN